MLINLKKFAYLRIASISPAMKVADVGYNAEQIIETAKLAHAEGATLCLFPELSLSGYTCGDLFYQTTLFKAIDLAIAKLCQFTKETKTTLVVGAPIRNEGRLFNCAMFISGGSVLGVVPKTYIPNGGEYYEERWFSSSKESQTDEILIGDDLVPFGSDLIFKAVDFPSLQIGIEICEDLWAVVPPSSYLSAGGASLILNPSSSSEYLGKADYRRSLVANQSARCIAAYAYASSGANESTSDFVNSGHCLIYENGKLLSENSRFNFESNMIFADIDLDKLMSERYKNNTFADSYPDFDFREVNFQVGEQQAQKLKRSYSKYPFVPSDPSLRNEACSEILQIQSTALAKRLKHLNMSKVVIGISGGLDSTLALIATLRAFDKLKLERKGIIAITMPGLGTTSRTKSNAELLCELLGVTLKVIDIKSVSLDHFKLISHEEDNFDVVYENTQARMRTLVLMNLANKYNAIVVGTGDLSESALGWSTYNGDHMSMYGINSGVPKTLVRYIVDWAKSEYFKGEVSAVLEDILATPISPELLPSDPNGEISQHTEGVLGPYELHDFFLYHFFRFGFEPSKLELIANIAFSELYDGKFINQTLKLFIRRFFANQYKRNCIPDGPKVGTVALSPRGDWRMPSDSSLSEWINNIGDEYGA